MIINKCEFGCSSAQLIDSLLPASCEQKKIYHIPLTSGLVTDYEKEINRFIINKHDVDGIILDCTAEGPEKSKIQKLCQMLFTAGYSKNKIFYIDSGLDYFEFCNHAISPNWVASCESMPNLKNTNPIESRTLLFLILARIPKYQRLQFIIKMFEKGLDKVSIISCGSNELGEALNDDVIFDKFVPKTLRHLFPVLLNNERISRHSASTDIDPIFKNCLINVVLESNYENNLRDEYGPLPVHSWDRFFYTEKTDKCFYMEQIPLFLAKAGYVSEIRKHGFDLFEDIVDHSYDNITDPIKRIETLANECRRLNTIGLSTFLSLPNLTKRLANNKLLPLKIRTKYLNDFKFKFLKWLNSI